MGDCASLDQLFRSLRTDGDYQVTIVSNQPDGIVGFGGEFSDSVKSTQLTMRSIAPGVLSGSTSAYCFSDRTHSFPGSGSSGGRLQGFSVKSPATVSASISRTGSGQYAVVLDFGTGINRHYEFRGHCVGEAIVGFTDAIGDYEHVYSATYTITVGRFTQDVVLG